MKNLLAGLLLLVSASNAQAGCLIVGDSIAVGVSSYLGGCSVSAKIGISSKAIISRSSPADVLIISAGSNDPTNPRLEANLREIRKRGKPKEVVWIIPRHPRASSIVQKVARSHEDRAVAFSPARDGVHPRSYKTLSQSILKALNTRREK